MVVSRRFEPPDLIVASLRGVVTAHDQTDLLDWVRAAIARVGAVRLLILLESFGGWHPATSFSTQSWLDDDEGVERIAIVGRSEWKVAILTFIAQPLRRLPIRYFEHEEAARRWLHLQQQPTSEPVSRNSV